MPVAYQRAPRSAYPQGVSATSSEALRKRYVDELIVNVSPADIPLTKLIGFGKAVDNIKVEWQQDALLTNSTALTASITALAAGANDTWTITSGDGAAIQKYHLLRVRKVAANAESSEIVWVYDEPTGDTLPVIRGYSGTTPIAVTLPDTTHRVDIIGVAIPDNQDSPRSATTRLYQLSNYVQQFDRAFQVSHAQQQMNLYGVDNDYDYQLAKKLKEVAVELEKALFYGRAAAPDTTNDRPATMGGLEEYVTPNGQDMAGAQITELKINQALQDIYDKVGAANMGKMTLVCNSAVKRQISRIYAYTASTNYKVELSREERTGGVVVNAIDTDFGLVDILMHKFCPVDRAYLLSLDKIKVAPLKNSQWFTEELPADGPYRKGHIYGAYTMIVKAPECHGFVKNISTVVS